MVTLIDGLLGGLVATIVMTAVMMTLGDDSPPPTALFWAKYVAGGNADPDDHLLPGMVLHLIYGVVAGGVLVAALLTVGALGDLLAFTTLVGGLLWGIAWGLVLFVGAAVFWMNVVLALDPDPEQVGGFLLFHLVYGVVLGAWIGVGVLA